MDNGALGAVTPPVPKHAALLAYKQEQERALTQLHLEAVTIALDYRRNQLNVA